MKSIAMRAGIILVFLIAGIFCLLPTFVSSSLPGLSTVLPGKIHLGLDLQGGMHLVLEVETNKAIENTADSLAEEIKDALRTKKIGFTEVARTGGWNIEAVLPSNAQVNDFNEALKTGFPMLETTSEQTGAQGTKILLAMSPQELHNLRTRSVQQAIETIRNRIDQFGVREPDIRLAGTDRIMIELPGVKDSQQAISLIGKTAVLEFKLVAQNVTQSQIEDHRLPPGVKLFPMRSSDATSPPSMVALEDKTVLTGDHITDARVEIGGGNSYGQASISLNFDRQGAKMFERITGDNVGRKLAIVLDGVVYSDPVIKDRIPDGRAVIEGAYSDEDAKVLAIALRTGRLPAPVKILEQSTVGPSLGHDSIKDGVMASAIAGLGIVLFMIVYYRMSGVVADLALVMNLILILALMAAVGATLTLPGIAGIALTIGIAVDANVLIYERIREELRFGKTPRAAIDTGYERATITIMDANVTSAIAALVLYEFGTGPVKGFAVTLFFGLAANMFTAIFVTRVIFDYLLTERRVKELSI
ncbi:MAG: protein translocase subunit SecD [Syntrophobacteraceae bacterium]|nr:protein translocase subunit SecD [Syntrophobacteraceae bacterium]